MLAIILITPIYLPPIHRPPFNCPLACIKSIMVYRHDDGGNLLHNSWTANRHEVQKTSVRTNRIKTITDQDIQQFAIVHQLAAE